MKVNEIFASIQGEGKYAGTPALFIRLSGCNRNCDFCDTKFHNEGKEMNVSDVVDEINTSSLDKVIFTGGEPCLQKEEIKQVITRTKHKKYHLETNATIIDNEFLILFEYIAFSPKTVKDMKYFVSDYNPKLYDCDIKVVTDLHLVGKNMLKDATMLMPLSTGNKKADLEIKKSVWKYCVINNKKYTPRIHVDVFGLKRRGV